LQKVSHIRKYLPIAEKLLGTFHRIHLQIFLSGFLKKDALESEIGIEKGTE
jgi:hypothetical protein